jgi:ComF family protein
MVAGIAQFPALLHNGCMTADALYQHIRESAGRMVDALLPPTCGVCQQVVDQTGALCASCWQQLNFIAAPYCACCGLPFSLPVETPALCATCLTVPPPYSRARSALVYDDVSRPLVSRFKYSDHLHLQPILGPWLQRAGADLLPGCDLIVPVPLHRFRLWRRRYNQAALLARALADGSGVRAETRLLHRIKATAPQVGMSREQRQKNVRHAFVVARPLKGETVILVDDVWTTGATLDACTTALLSSGAGEVRLLTLARVIRPGQLE